VGQLGLKEGVIRSPSLAFSVPLLLNPFVLAGLAAYFLAALFYINAIRQVPLSIAFPSVSVSYVVVSLFAHWIWGEAFGRSQIFALVLISAGIYILGREAT
jgi:drug/metabolite transporter (DMT)-like permease